MFADDMIGIHFPKKKKSMESTEPNRVIELQLI